VTHLELITAMVKRAAHHPRGEELRYLADQLDRFVAGSIPPRTVTPEQLAETRQEAEDLWNATATH
jgi:hypothetical protein